MKKFMFLILIMCLTLVGCGNDVLYRIDSSSKEYNSTESGEENILYVVNTLSKKYHLPDCYYAENIKEEYREETYNLNFLISKGYTPCSKCLGDII